MTLPLIIDYYSPGLGLKLNCNARLALVNKACPWVRYNARASCAEYLGIDDLSTVSNPRIQAYILETYNYDAISISKIISALRAYNENKVSA
jgi:hypothetical protein